MTKKSEARKSRDKMEDSADMASAIETELTALASDKHGEHPVEFSIACLNVSARLLALIKRDHSVYMNAAGMAYNRAINAIDKTEGNDA